ncbi:hypothetical protein ACP275_12G007100 [Erythranthe tilingii]
MDAPLRHHHPTTAVNPPEETPPDPSNSGGKKPKTAIHKRKNKKKKQTLVSDSASSASSNNCSCVSSSSQKGIKISRSSKRIRVGSLTTARKFGPGDVDALGLPLGMSIAAVVAQVLERKSAAGEKISTDSLSEICILAVKESLGNVFGDKFDNFATNFEKSFRSTLMTLRLINDSSSQSVEEHTRKARFRKCSCSVEDSRSTYSDGVEDSRSDRDNFISIHENLPMNLMSQQLVLRDDQIIEPNFASIRSTGSSNSMLSTIEKSVVEQTRSNDLKAFEIGLIMKKMQLKERQLELNCDANLLDRWKLSMGFSKASFKAEKFKTQLQDNRQVEMLRKCLDFLVAGLIIMLFSIGYGTYVYSHRRIIEASEACSPYTESKSWWMPKSMSTFNSGIQLLLCQIQVFSRMLFGGIMIGAITFLLIQRSATSNQTMPITFILLLLGVACGYAGKFCIDTLGGSGNHWLIYWEALCLLHFLSNTFYSTLFSILNGPIIVAQRAEHNKTVFPYWMRRSLFYSALLVLPLMCGFMPFAGPREWFNHFVSGALDLVAHEDDD